MMLGWGLTCSKSLPKSKHFLLFTFSLLVDHLSAQTVTLSSAASSTSSPIPDSTSSTRFPSTTSTITRPSTFSTTGRANSTLPQPSSTRLSCTGNQDAGDNCSDTTTPPPPGSDNGASGYYYVFIAVFFVLIGAFIWVSTQRRQKRLIRNAHNRQSALARDMQNEMLYPNNRRWTGEGRRSHGRIRSGPARTRRDEGLDDRGEAPPPYKPDNIEPAVAMPMQTLQRDGTANKPPDYDEEVTARARGESGDVRPSST